MLLQLKRRALLIRAAFLSLLLLTNSVCTITSKPRIRSCRRMNRNVGWWNNVWQNYSDSRFKATFRISKATFRYILERIRPDLERSLVVEEPISPECRLAICLYRLGRGDYPYTISEMSGLGVSTIRKIVMEVCEVIISKLWEEVSNHFPKTEGDFKEKMVDTEELWQFPCCWSAVDGCHIPISCPPGGQISNKEYHNFKIFYSIVLMALVDAKCRFVWASAGFPGNSHDSVILQSTTVWQKITKGQTIPPIAKQIGKTNVSPLIVGDSAFPFSTYLMKPYSRGILSEQQKYFNYRLSRSRMVAESAFGQLKSRWRILYRKCECSKDTVKVFALACVVLHNICIERGETLSSQLDISVDPATQQRRDREKVREMLEMRACPKTNDTCQKANGIRSAITEYLWNEKNASTT